MKINSRSLILTALLSILTTTAIAGQNNVRATIEKTAVVNSVPVNVPALGGAANTGEGFQCTATGTGTLTGTIVISNSLDDIGWQPAFTLGLNGAQGTAGATQTMSIGTYYDWQVQVTAISAATTITCTVGD